VAAPAHNANRGYLEAAATKWRNNSVNNVMQFSKMQLFWAALPGGIGKVLAQHDQNTMTLDDMYQTATTTKREARAKLAKTVATLEEDSHSNIEDDDDEVEAFQNPRNTRFPN
jgi:hypothetical protein